MGRIIRCHVPHCPNKKGECSSEILFFSFPPGLRGFAWAKAIKRPDMKIYSKCRVCSEHFSENDFKSNMGSILGIEMRDRLTLDAIPSLKLPESLEDAKKWEDSYYRRIRSKKTDSVPEQRLQKKTEEENPSPIEPCLICSESVQPADHSNRTRYKFSGAQESLLLNEQLWHTFILKKIVNFPTWRYHEILLKTGASLHPSSWFALCTACSGFIESIAKLLDRIKELELTAEKRIKSIRDKFEENLLKEVEKPNANQILCVRNEIRNFMRAPTQQLVPKEENVPPSPTFGYDVEDEGNSASSRKVKRRILRNPKDESTPSAMEESESEYEAENEKCDEEWAEFPSAEGHSTESELEVDPIDEDNDNNYAHNFRKTRRRIRKRSQNTLDGAFDCLKCKASFRKLHSLQVHLQKKHHLESDKDWTTNQRTTSENNRVSESSSSDPRPFKCSVCPRMYDTTNKLEHHKKLHERSKGLNGGLFDCFVCKAPCSKASSTRLHLIREHQLKLPRDWDGTGLQENHVRLIKKKGAAKVKIELEQKYSCKLCPCEFDDSSKFQIHEKAHQESKEAGQDCPKCNYPCVTIFNLNKHMKSAHRVSAFVCNICGEDSGNAYRLQGHIFNHKIHDGSVRPDSIELFCNICEKTFKTRRALSVHKVSTHYKELGLTVYKCSECPKVYAQKNALHLHVLKDHKNMKKFRCEICGYGAITRTVLESHMYRHSSERFMCEHCSATYANPEGLKGHLRLYHPNSIISKRTTYLPQGIKPKPRCKDLELELKCKYCGKILPNKIVMKHHLESDHKDLYTHKCDRCDKIYISAASLQLHKKINHAQTNQAVKCKWCLKKVNHKIYLYSHMKSCKKKPSNLGAAKIAVADEMDVDQAQ
ncbi:unnamed protein product [Orchesella dallaii]|uniref:Zinc finger protein n=1 Tax=Orchesella dallaii TaxID=48710 RepID=A0ABP1QDN0_9HEXA